MPTSAARKTTSSRVTRATSEVRNAMRAARSASARTRRRARSLASPQMSWRAASTRELSGSGPEPTKATRPGGPDVPEAASRPCSSSLSIMCSSGLSNPARSRPSASPHSRISRARISCSSGDSRSTSMELRGMHAVTSSVNRAFTSGDGLSDGSFEMDAASPAILCTSAASSASSSSFSSGTTT
nr:unnamed protein product [Digitaria exilis]